MSPILFALLLGAPASAQESEDEFDFIKPDDEVEEDKVESGDFNLYGDEDDFEIAPAAPIATVQTSKAPALPTIAGEPLSGGNDGFVAGTADGSKVVELPIYVTNGEPGEDFWLRTTAWIGAAQVGESWQQVNAASVPAAGPGFVFVKMQVPGEGEIELRVARAGAPGEEGEELFRKVISQ